MAGQTQRTEAKAPDWSKRDGELGKDRTGTKIGAWNSNVLLSTVDQYSRTYSGRYNGRGTSGVDMGRLAGMSHCFPDPCASIVSGSKAGALQENHRNRLAGKPKMCGTETAFAF